MTAQTFGRKGQADDAEMARRREAFIAQERARQANAPQAAAPEPAPRFGALGAAAMPASAAPAPVKSVGVAYLFWFVFGGLGGHRHYLGFHTSGWVQSGAWLVNLMMMLSGNIVIAIPMMLLCGLWVLSDAFILRSLCRDANARLSRPNVQSVFA